MKIGPDENWVLLGASSGLGQAFAQLVSEHQIPHRLISRKSEISYDFSEENDWPHCLGQIRQWRPTRLFYFAGGGPWGPYQEKKWSSHQWTYRVNLLFPAYLLANLKLGEMGQMTFVGSAVAEANPDPGAASYASAKHGLCGLLTSLQKERSGVEPRGDLRLFSPGYLDTPLLPRSAWPRQHPGLVKSPQAIAEFLFKWVQDPEGADRHWKETNNDGVGP